MKNLPTSASGSNSIGIICGSGSYPKLVAAVCMEKNLDFCMLFVNDNCNRSDFADYRNAPSLSVDIGKIGTALDFLHKHDVNKIVFAGGVKRPNFKQLALDAKGASWLLKLGKSVLLGDDALLSALAKLLQQEGFEVIAGTDLIGGAFVQAGVLSSKQPAENDFSDIKIGVEAARNIGLLDIGQSVIVHDGLVLGVECVEGTDQLIERCALLRKSETGGVLVKMSKPQQDNRLDLPTVGPNTIDLLHAHKFSGVAVESGKCIVIDRRSVLQKANDFSIFMYGVS